MKITKDGGCNNYPECGHKYPDCIDLQQCLQRHPKLDSHGWCGSGRPEYAGINYEEFRLCCHWIMDNRRRGASRGKWQWYSSYLMKHVVEKASHTYISNGAFCAAATLLIGSKHIRHGGGPNIGVFLPPGLDIELTRGGR